MIIAVCTFMPPQIVRPGETTVAISIIAVKSLLFGFLSRRTTIERVLKDERNNELT